MADVESRYKKPENYVNRELSWLDFDYRILEEARDKSLPLFERLKFLSITASNLDEFFMVRVASLKDMVNAGYTKPDLSGMKPSEQLEKIGEKTHRLVEMQYSTYNRSLIPALKANGLRVISHHEELTEEEKELVSQLSSYEEKFDAAMDDDLNTADALAAIFELVRFANTHAGEESSKAFLSALKEKIVSLSDVLGLIAEKKEEMLDADIEALIEERQAARKARNFARADEIRNELLSKGIVLEDTREGVKWKRA